jgi:hypothetical protein
MGMEDRESGVTFSWGCAEELVAIICTQGMVRWASEYTANISIFGCGSAALCSLAFLRNSLIHPS